MTYERLVDQAFAIGLQQIPEEILALVKFVAALRPKNVLEIGSARGASFYLWCMVADPNGKKISVDLPGGLYGGEENADPRIREKRDNTMRSWAKGIYLIAGDSHRPEIYNRVSTVLGEDELDFLFIDGDHTYEGVRADYEFYSGFVRKSGWIAFHDINDTVFHRSQNVGVSRLWQELQGRKIEFNSNQEWAGIGVIQPD
jgi:cephalosporin hydroxylase